LWTGVITATFQSSGTKASHPTQITTPAPYHSVFYRPDAFLAAQPTASKH